MHEETGVGSPGLPVRGGQCCDARKQISHWRRVVSDCAGRADRRASSAAGAHHRVYGDMVPRRRNGAGRAEVEATRAGGLGSARMGAQGFLQAHIDRLLKCADHLRRFKDGSAYRVRITRICSEIAFPLVGRGEERRPAPQVKNDIAA